MFTNDWQVQIRQAVSLVGFEIFVFRKVGDKIQIVNGDIAETVEEGAAVKPTLILGHEQLKTFAEELNKMGINATKEYTEGRLEATEAHLSDMRQLLKLK